MYKTFITINMLEPTKCYVGMTGTSSKYYKGSGKYFKKALSKYGSQNFKRVDLVNCESSDEAHYWEGFYIKTLKTLVIDGGYNISPLGGLKGAGSSPIKGKHNVPEERKERIRKSLTGKSKSKEHIENVKNALTGRTTKQRGVPISDEHKQKIKDSWKVRRVKYPMTNDTKNKISESLKKRCEYILK